MEILVLKGKVPNSGYFIRVSREEALQLISSLSLQILANDPNGPRTEFYAQSRKYFSIAVQPQALPSEPMTFHSRPGESRHKHTGKQGDGNG